MKQFDVIIIGSGPSGSILSYLLSKSNLSVCVIDRRNFTGSNTAFVKACGGLLAPDAQRALATLNLTIPAYILASPQIFAVKTIDLQTGLFKYYQRFYLNVDRTKFDAYLAALPNPKAVKLYGKTVKSIKYTDNLYHVLLTDGTTVVSRLLVGADGASSITAKALGMVPNVKKYVCIQQIFSKSQDQNLYSAIFNNKLTDYSGWTFVKDDKTYVGAAFQPGSDAHEKLDKIIELLTLNGYKFGLPLRREGAILNRPYAFIKTPVNKNNTAALIGEAAGFVSPSSAEGISFAINSAIYAYKSIIKCNSFTAYRKLSIKIRLKLFMKNFKLPFMYNKVLRNFILKSGISSITTFNT